MIKIDTSKKTEDGAVELALSGNSIDIASEALTLIMCLKDAIRQRREGFLGELDSMVFETFFRD